MIRRGSLGWPVVLVLSVAHTNRGPDAMTMFEENGTPVRIDGPIGNRTGNTVKTWPGLAFTR